MQNLQHTPIPKISHRRAPALVDTPEAPGSTEAIPGPAQLPAGPGVPAQPAASPRGGRRQDGEVEQRGPGSPGASTARTGGQGFTSGNPLSPNNYFIPPTAEAAVNANPGLRQVPAPGTQQQLREGPNENRPFTAVGQGGAAAPHDQMGSNGASQQIGGSPAAANWASIPGPAGSARKHYVWQEGPSATQPSGGANRFPDNEDERQYENSQFHVPAGEEAGGSARGTAVGGNAGRTVRFNTDTDEGYDFNIFGPPAGTAPGDPRSILQRYVEDLQQGVEGCRDGSYGATLQNGATGAKPKGGAGGLASQHSLPAQPGLLGAAQFMEAGNRGRSRAEEILIRNRAATAARAAEESASPDFNAAARNAGLQFDGGSTSHSTLRNTSAGYGDTEDIGNEEELRQLQSLFPRFGYDLHYDLVRDEKFGAFVSRNPNYHSNLKELSFIRKYAKQAQTHAQTQLNALLTTRRRSPQFAAAVERAQLECALRWQRLAYFVLATCRRPRRLACLHGSNRQGSEWISKECREVMERFYIMDRTVLRLTLKISAMNDRMQQQTDLQPEEQPEQQQHAPGAAAAPFVPPQGTNDANRRAAEPQQQQQRAREEQQQPPSPPRHQPQQPPPQPEEADGGDAGRGDQRRPPPAGAAGGGGGGGGGGDSDPGSSDIDWDDGWDDDYKPDGGNHFDGGDNDYRQPEAKDNSAQYMNGVLQCLNKMTEFMEKTSSAPTPSGTGYAAPALRPTKLPQLQLPKFAGSFQEWPQFYANWRAKVDSRAEISPLDKMLYLLSCLQPGQPAHQAVAGLPVDADSYEIAIQTLRRKYSNRKILLGDVFSKILAYPMVKSMGAARAALDFLKTQIRAFKTHDVQMEDQSFNALLLFIIENKFPGAINAAWQKMQVRKEEESGVIEYSRDHFSAPYHHSYTVLQFLAFTENLITVHENSSMRPQPTTADAGKRTGNADNATPAPWKDRTRSAGNSNRPASSSGQGNRASGGGNFSRPTGGGGNFKNRDKKQVRFGGGGKPAGAPTKPNTPTTRASPGTTKTAAAAGRKSGKTGIGTTSREMDQQTFGPLFTQNCPFCNNSAKEHLSNLTKCTKLHNMSSTEAFARIKHFNAAKKAKCCVRCLRLGHTSVESDCSSTCSKCSGRHNERLCPTRSQ